MTMEDQKNNNNSRPSQHNHTLQHQPLSIPAQNIIKTPLVPTPDCALRHAVRSEYGSYFPIQGGEVAISTSPPLSPSVGIKIVVPVAAAAAESILKRTTAATTTNEEKRKTKAEAGEEMPVDEEEEEEEKKPALEIPTPKEPPSPPPPSSASPAILETLTTTTTTTGPLVVPAPSSSSSSSSSSLPRSISAISISSNHSVSSSASDKETWDRTLSRVINGIVSIKATTTRPFDTESAGDYTATGFVISKKHGLILSNRHVVSPAPITSVAVFVNYEEIPIYPVYRDPVHDFGVFRYDPEKLKHIQVEEIELRPDLARVGEDIKVVGNDAGEKLSILGSTLARLDRHAPSYGVDSYNDFNTFYMQAASGTSGGSSGSPVLNIHGQAVALNAGGSNSSQSSFYLPLDRVVRAVNKLKNGEKVTRGTLQTEFLHQSYDELRRLGLKEDVEENCRARDVQATGLLSVVRVLRGGPASSDRRDAQAQGSTEGARGLEPGDILFTCNGKHITDFIGLWSIIDDSVGEDIELEIFRAGKEGGESGKLRVVCKVQDLHSITPNRFLEIGGAVIQDLSYQMGRSHNVQLGTGVFCAASGFLLWSSWSRDFLITSVSGKPTRTLDEFVEVIKDIPDYERVPIMSRSMGKTEDQMLMVDIDRHFFLAAMFERNDVEGTWKRTELPPPPPAKAIEQKIEETTEEEKKGDVANAEDEDEEEDPEEAALDKLKSSLVNVVCRLPYSIYGHTSASNYSGIGLIVSLDPVPLVLFDRSSVPTEMLDIRLTVSNKNISGRVVYIGAFALVTFDKSLLPKNVFVPTWDPKPLRVRDEVKVVGLTSDQLLVQKETAISSIGVNFNTWQCNPPRHRLINIENINVLEASGCWGGVIVRKPSKSATAEGKKPTTLQVSAYYMAVSSQNKSGDDSYWTQGLDIKRYVLPIVSKINSELATGPVEPPRRDLGIEFADMALATVSTMGLSQKRFDAFVSAAKKNRAVPRPLIVETRLRPNAANPSTPEEEEKSLKIADIVLSIDGQQINTVSQLTDLNLDHKPSVEMTILRGRKEQTITVPTVPSFPTSGTTVIQFFGAIVHPTHAAALEQVSPNTHLVPLTTSGVYVGGVSYGSPALDNIRPTHWILEVDETPVEDLDGLVKLVKENRWEQGKYVRVKQVNRKGITSVVSVKVDERFWPVMGWWKEVDGKWVGRKLSADVC